MCDTLRLTLAKWINGDARNVEQGSDFTRPHCGRVRRHALGVAGALRKQSKSKYGRLLASHHRRPALTSLTGRPLHLRASDDLRLMPRGS